MLKHAKFPDGFDAARVRDASTLFDFDDAVTAAVHGFQSAPDYYAQCSSGPFVEKIRVPLLLLSAEDDPFIPANTIARTANPQVTLEVTQKGGHLGFIEGPWYRPRFYAERRAVEFLGEQLDRAT